MAKYVREVMNKDLFWARRETAATAVLDALIGLGIGGAPVVELDGRPAGWVSLRDVAGDPSRRPTAAERMTSPAQTIGADARVEDAAHTIAATGRKHLVVLDDAGHAVGVVSAIDVLRELIGLPVPHPATFGHVDTTTGLTFTDDLVFEEASFTTAPDGPGVLMLVHALRGKADEIVWLEACANVRTRLYELLSIPQSPPLAVILEAQRHLRFRAAAARTVEAADEALQRARHAE